MPWPVLMCHLYIPLAYKGGTLGKNEILSLLYNTTKFVSLLCIYALFLLYPDSVTENNKKNIYDR